MNHTPSYVLITPARNEEATIGITIESVIRQTVAPREWVIVSDGSTDRTDEIVKRYASENRFIRLLRLDNRPARNFASVVFATEAGIASLTTKDYGFIGLLDADIRFKNNYYEEILRHFVNDPALGIAGGWVLDSYRGQLWRGVYSPQEVAGAVQLFRRKCFDSIEKLIAIPEGGWDAITCVQARMNGFKTHTFSDIEVEHLKPRNIAEGNLLRRNWQLGVREYAVGNHPLFEFAKCGYRCFQPPLVLGGILRAGGYSWSCMTRLKRLLPLDIIHFIRREQMARLFRLQRYRVKSAEPTRLS
jgi:poly-beta-1,6-N-acetyl-D-glucosamine synthase